MTVKIRMKRMGRRNRAFFRIVAADSRFPRDGRFIEELGYYDPVSDPEIISIDYDKVAEWTTKGAQVSDTVKTLIKRSRKPDEARKSKPKQKPVEQTEAEVSVETGAEAAPEPSESDTGEAVNTTNGDLPVGDTKNPDTGPADVEVEETAG